MQSSHSSYPTLATAWPHLNETDETVDLAISNTLANLSGYPHGRDDELFASTGLRRAELTDLLERWRRVASQSKARGAG